MLIRRSIKDGTRGFYHREQLMKIYSPLIKVEAVVFPPIVIEPEPR